MMNLAFMNTDSKTPQNLGVLYAVADKQVRLISWTPATAVNGTINYFDPLTTSTPPTPQPLTFTFSKAVNIAALEPVFTSANNNNYNLIPAIVVNSSDETTITVTPVTAFKKNDTITVTLKGLIAKDGSSFNATSNKKTFYTKKGILPIAGNWLDSWGNKDGFSIASDIVVTFNIAPASFDTSKTSIFDGAKDIPATITIVGNTLVFNPEFNLDPAKTYTVKFAVKSAILGDNEQTDANFTAILGATSNQFKPTAVSSIHIVNASWLDSMGVDRENVVNTENLIITFSAAPVSIDTTKTLLKKGATEIPSNITLSGTTLTFNPGFDLEPGDYTLTWDVTSGIAGDVSLTQVGFDNTFTIKTSGTIKLLSSNTMFNNSTAVTDFAVDSNISLVFDSPVQDKLKDGTTAYTIVLKDGILEVPAVVTLSADRLTATIDPVNNLNFSKSYTVSYNVFNGVKTSNDSGLTDLTAFKTAKGGVSGVSVLTKDDQRKVKISSRTTYNANELALYIKASKALNAASCSFEYRLTEMGKTAPITWTATTATLTYQDATSWYYDVVSPVWKSGDTVEIRAKSKGNTGYDDSIYSAALSFTDQVAPTAVTATGLINAALVGNPVQNVAYDVNTNISTTAALSKTYTFEIDSNIALPTVTLATGSTGITYDVVIDATDPTKAILTLYIDKAAVQDPLEITTGSLTIGEQYRIKELGNTTLLQWQASGAVTGTVGELFTATSAGAGTGIVYRINNPTLTSGSFVIGTQYEITTVGTTDFTLIGASSNAVGTKFIATGVGTTSTGTATRTDMKSVNPQGSLTVKITDGSLNVVDFLPLTAAQDDLTIVF